MVFHILLILWQANFKLTATFPYGTSGYPPLAFDSDHNGIPELFMHSGVDTGTVVCEHIGNNQYISSRLFGIHIHAVGYGDEDSLTDAYVHVATPPSYIDPIGVYESRNYNGYPDSCVCWLVDSTPYGTIGYFIDFDRDGKMDLIISYLENNTVDHFSLFENTGDNSYAQTFEYDFPNIGPVEMAIDDFDGDGLLEIVCGDIDGKAYVFENTAIGIDSFRLIWTYQLPFANAYITAKGNDMDHDGKLEFIVGTHGYGRWCFTMFETNGNNSYQKIWQKIYYPMGSLTYGDVDCGDVDGDGTDELVTFGGLELYVWKCVGPDSFVQIWQNYYYYDLSDGVLVIHDLNQNGLAEIVLSGANWWGPPQPPAKTYIYEKAVAVTWFCPAPLDTFHPGDTVNLRWRFDEIVSLDSLRLYWSHPQLGCYFIYEGPATDTTYQWVVPDTQANIPFKVCLAVTGNCRYDSLISPPFYIKRVPGIEETINSQFAIRNPQLMVYPNPFSKLTYISFEKVKSEKTKGKRYELKIYDATGRLIRQWDDEMPQASTHAHMGGAMRQGDKISWNGTDDAGCKLPTGVYFICLKTNEDLLVKKIIKIE